MSIIAPRLGARFRRQLRHRASAAHPDHRRARIGRTGPGLPEPADDHEAVGISATNCPTHMQAEELPRLPPPAATLMLKILAMLC